MIKSDSAVYAAIERVLKAAGNNPLTCVDVHDDAEVRRLVESTNRVSDYLGHMWRRGVVQRWFAAKESTQRARYAYTWQETPAQTPKTVELSLVQSTPAPDTSKPNIDVVYTNGVAVLEFDTFTITIKRK